ncbi:MAG: hypothetical protein K2X62_12380 [Beijerinckiaceae bacterium]|nr:hypothetical protein [Beijerinckiaceae bacterium]
MARIIARWVDDTTESPLAIDLHLVGGRVSGPSLAFGCVDWEGARRPFVMDEDGRIDFGAGHDRFWRTDLRAATIKVGETFRIFWRDGDEGVYRIVKIAVPGSKA